ncbi:MAG TPA: DUF2298 domain-containing protein, partial [Thermomicrobiales bacterium]|nr:DUF2298 domain-containing protein [Thermomicrobiales bacterium]
DDRQDRFFRGRTPLMSAVLAAAQWYAVLLVVTWCVAPWVRLLCPGMPDKGAFVARPLALLAVVYPLWLLSSVFGVPYSTAGLWLTVLLAGVGGWVLIWRRGKIDRPWLKAQFVAEAMSLAAFGLYAWWRGYAPQILNTEKPMDIAFLASSSRAQSMPPPDPWLAGETINYYYLGYLLQGALTRMSGVVPTVGFNLALATTFCITVTAASGTAFALVRDWASVKRAAAAGVLAVLFVVFAGNLYAAKELVRQPAETVAADWWTGVGWNASRIVVDHLPGQGLDESTLDMPPVEPVATINEFPAFSFVLGDLHPHVLALPFTIVTLYLAFALYHLSATHAALDRSYLARLALAGAVAGSLYMLNSWDFPTYLVIVGLAVWFGTRHLEPRRRLAALATMAAASVLFWVPFFVQFTPPVGADAGSLPGGLGRIPVVSALLASVGAMQWEHTSAQEFLTVFGVPYVFALWFLVDGVFPPRVLAAENSSSPPDRRSIGLFAAAVLAFGLFLGAPVVILSGIPLILAALQAPSRRASHGPATLLFAVGFALILGTEFFYIQDVFGNRMNTLFKIYFQAWTLFGIASAVGIVALWRDAGLSGLLARRALRPALAFTSAVALVAVLIYPVLAASDYSPAFEPREWRGLDGMAFIGRSSPAELEAMRWIAANAAPDDVVLEAVGCSYAPWGEVPTSRVSAFTGVPTVLGWPGHERQWHLGDEALWQELQRRAEVIDRLFSPDGDALRDAFGVSLIFVGGFERDGTMDCEAAGPYEGVNDPRFPGPGWDVAFQEGDVTVYQRVDEATASSDAS